MNDFEKFLREIGTISGQSYTMLTDISKKIKPLIFGIAACCIFGSAATAPTASAETLSFAKSGRLSQGNWVKVAVDATGVCRITYDELAGMGFSSPENVAVFGRGGQKLETNFKDKDGNVLYDDALDAVSTMHKDNALYFFAMGPQHMRYTSDGVNRVTNNVYTNHAYYFLTDTDSGAKIMGEANAVVDTNAKTTYDKALGYQLIERDIYFPTGSGEEFFGWVITDSEDNKVSLPYSLPGSEKDDEVRLVYYGVANITGPSYMQIALTGDGQTESIGQVGFYTVKQDYTYTYSNNFGVPTYLSGKLPAGEGEIVVTNQYPARTSYAAIDYVVLTAPRSLAFQRGEGSYIVYTPDYTADKGPVAIASAPEDIVVWDVVNSNDVVKLPVSFNEEGTAFAAGLREDADQGKLVAFSPSGNLLSVKGFQQVENQNVHALASGEMPAMLIVTTAELKDTADRLAGLHKTYQNENVVVVTSDELVNEFSQGTPDPMAYRAAAKMFYDADDAENRTFKNVMLFGPMRLDNRGATSRIPTDKDLLICKQTEQGDSGYTAFTILDNYGQMADYYGPEKSDNNYYLRTMDIAVGVVPADRREVAELYVDKVKKYMEDQEVATWMGNVIYTADGSNANEHQEECNRASNTWVGLDNSFTPHRLFNNSYSADEVRKNFLTVINNGALWANYLGHASSYGLNTLLWDRGDYTKLSSDHLGFMYFGGCTITDFDRGGRGSGEEMILLTDKGLVGGVISTRTTLSVSNWTLLEDFVKSALMDRPFGENKTAALLKEPRTFGEIARIAFSQNSRGNSNKLAYVLMCDPALTSYLPSADVKITSRDKELTQITPGTYVEVEGAIYNRVEEGETASVLDDFNGKVVVSLFAPSVTLPSRQVDDSEPMEVVHDNNVISTSTFDVENGKFAGSITVPESLGAAGSTLTIRMTAFDPGRRRTATGNVSATALPFDDGISVADTESPVVEKFYVDSASFNSGDPVGDKPILYAVITDNFGMSYFNNSPAGNPTLKIDGKQVGGSIWPYISLADKGRTLNMRFPQEEMTAGTHSAQIEAFDLAGNPCSSTIFFHVQKSGIPSSTGIEVSSNLVRDEDVTVNISTPSDAGYTVKSADLIITDALGNVVSMVEASGGSADWNITDNDGNRVAPGIYYAHCRFVSDAGVAGVSEPVRLIVMRPSSTE